MKSELSAHKKVLLPTFAQWRSCLDIQKGGNLPSDNSAPAFNRHLRAVVIAGTINGRLLPWLYWRLGLLLLTLYLIGAAGAAAEGCKRLSPDCFTTFLTGLEKQWSGRATYTPVGPRPYDITFKRHSPGRLEGTARPGEMSTHYWSFYQEDQTLRLRFLSTFAGNTRPLLLRATEVAENTWIFKSPRPRFLEVHVKPKPQALGIVIFLRGERHVEIHLKQRPQ